MFQNPNIFFSNLNSNRSDLLDVSNRQKQVKKVFSYQELTFIVWINCFGHSFEFQKFFLISWTISFTVGQNNFGNKIPLHKPNYKWIIQAWLFFSTKSFNLFFKVNHFLDASISSNGWLSYYVTKYFSNL